MTWISPKFGTDTHVAFRFNFNTFGDPQTFDLAPSSGQYFSLSITSAYDQILARLMTFLSAVIFVWY